MLVPISWLREFTPYEGTAEALGDRLTMLGLELEEILNPFAGLENIKVGFVAACTPHPDSDHMHCCKVDVGTEELVDIVCGAPNVAQGQKVAVALVGTVLPDGTRIGKAKLRGQPSCGMICSERELGLSEDHDGIMVLPESADVGHSLVAALGLDTEVLDLSITPNRADCLSILGVARETAAAYHLPLRMPVLPLILDKDNPEIQVPLQIDAPELCWLYSGRVVTGAKVGKSPMRMRYRLHSAGIRAISNIVDVTNYILFECGQPLHAFDLDKLQGQRIIVRRAKDGERLITLDGKERILKTDDLCICDAERPVALAGVMGGLNTEITDSSRNVFIESAVFEPRNIRRTSRKLGLQSEASYRYERGVDSNHAVSALDRACALMASVSGGFVRRGFAFSEPRPFRAARISFSPKDADALLGIEVPGEEQKKILTGLGCAVEQATATAWTVIQPSWRHDLTRAADLVEEVGRVYGYDKIEPVLPQVTRKLGDSLYPVGPYEFGSLIRRWGAGLGLHEAINYSFVGSKDLDAFNLGTEKRLSIFNPLSEDQGVLRTSLAPGLLRDLSNNLAFGAQSVRLFELGNAFESDTASETGASEKMLLGILLYGLRFPHQWPHGEEYLDYADLRGVMENLFAWLHLDSPKIEAEGQHPYLLPCARMSFGASLCGYMGRLKPAIAKDYNAQRPVWLAELDLELLRLLHEQAVVEFQPLPVYPGIRRDITMEASRDLQAQTILDKIMLANIPNLEGAILLDNFEEQGKQERNLTFRLTFRAGDRTLKDSEVDKQRELLADYLRKEFGAKI